MNKLQSVKHCFRADGICSYCVPKCVTLLMGRSSLCIAEQINCNLLGDSGFKLMHVKHCGYHNWAE